ncbi:MULTISPECIES: hypothetical protein [unclassified Sulfitobacter]|uniref:hypothetical protein n=1 Tax=unclassified Sulfitobacter TaxID=196795 RepID=UPI0023E21808|nr:MULTISPECIES: hypothetical protein [unclassified Sulfitobacter]MDF3384508.1 hypothetical protein [Sulfitobacter sp. Ks11]MDF3387926.1 hypothetical protein [Sulfitobacter sp. M85]MDF3391346.1 hypothetical protein [Sulfitobacter sp. Ks16]MDF3401984.1 hypothetical protein [Sulfitobacter sp. KE39]MDF3405405.1 hypothetical protein [Sulfitobacter sp. Ks35]
MANKKIGGPQRLLHGLAKFDGEYPTNKQGRVDLKNLTILLIEVTKGDGKYQVREHDKQYFTKDENLRDQISEINVRLYQSHDVGRDIDDLAAGRIAAVTKQAKSARENAIKAKADYAAVLQRLSVSEQRNAALTRELQSLREQMQLIRQGIMPRVK